MRGRAPAAIQCASGRNGGNVRYHYKPDFTAHFDKQKTYHEEQPREGNAQFNDCAAQRL